MLQTLAQFVIILISTLRICETYTLDILSHSFVKSINPVKCKLGKIK